jgi:hypothetical protein
VHEELRIRSNRTVRLSRQGRRRRPVQ